MLTKAFLVTPKNNHQEEGIVISENILAVPDTEAQGGMKYRTLLGVLWTNPKKRSPAISYHDPDELRWVGLFPDESPYHVFYEAQEDDEDDTEDSEVVETQAEQTI